MAFTCAQLYMIPCERGYWEQQLNKLKQSSVSDVHMTGVNNMALCTAEYPDSVEVLTRMLASETFAAECAIGIDTTEVAFTLDNTLEEARDLIPPGARRDRVVRKLRNIWETYCWLFLNDDDPVPMGPGLAKSIHTNLMSGLECNSEWRSVNLKPAGTAKMYLPHQRVPKAMADLFSFLVDQTDYTDIKHTFALATVFFYAFLFIHPFRNGNGRTARLLLSYYLREVTAVPIAIASSRDRYIGALEKVDTEQDMHPLMQLITGAAVQSLSNVQFFCERVSE